MPNATLTRLVVVLLSIPVALTLGACSSGGGGSDDYEPIDFETWVDGKEDTGYLSNKAAELEASLTSSVYIDMTGQSAADIQAKADSLQTASRWTLQGHTSPQLKYGRNALKSEQLDLNLERGEPTVLTVRTDANGVWVDFETTIESLVKVKELAEKGLTPADLVGKQIEFQLPTVPATVFEKGGMDCANDPDGDELHADDLNSDNYFYYFDPAKSGCPLAAGTDLVLARYVITSSMDAASVYPEYDLLTQDKRITMVALFGQITHGDLESGDWGWIAYEQWLRDLKNSGFRKTDTFDNDFGEQYSRTYAGDLEVVINNYTPEALKDHRPREEVNEMFMQAIHDHEIVYYNGHAFYGSLNVLDRPEAYPDSTYQIIFMDACWSYAYYTKQVFENKVRDDDPDGMKFSDVVNNTEPGITGSHKTAWLLYKNMFKAASEFMQGKAPTKYSWNTLIVYMNDSADRRARYYDPEKFHAEIYGASGVTSNCFNPTGPSYCNQGGGTSLTHDYTASDGERDIPDNNASGVSSTINVPDSYAVQTVEVALDIKHTYIGDLRVSLSHNGTERVLHDNTGGGTDDIRTSFSVSGFNAAAAQGDWILTVVDSANADTGKLVTWSLTLNEASSNPDLIEASAEPGAAIPDNDPAGTTSVIGVSDPASVGELMVHVQISHSYVGDLKISLEHGGVTEVLRDREGGSAENLDLDFTPDSFAGQTADGDWSLTVSDHAGADVGTLDAWSLTIIPAP